MTCKDCLILDHGETLELCPLHASAPALLAALEECEGFLSRFRSLAMEGQITITDYAEKRLPSDYDAITAARAAIAQAKGESK